jgi:hypothetical protein
VYCIKGKAMLKAISIRLDEGLIARIKRQNAVPSKFIRKACLNSLRFEKLIKQAEKLRETYRMSALEIRARK